MKMNFVNEIIYFNKIYILESLKKDEKQTGTELHDDVILRRSWQKPNLLVEIIKLESKNDLIELLIKIKEECLSNEIIPFIHFELHGFNKGIALKNNDKILWSEIVPIIREINITSKNNLFISVAACKGGNIQHEIKITEPCPFRGFIGPMEDIATEDLLISFTNFFDELLVSNNFDKAIDRLNQNNNSGVIFHYLSSESFYKIVLDFHFKELIRNPKNHEERVAAISKNYWKNNPNAQEQFRTKGRLKKSILKFEKSEEPLFYKELKNRFLHIE